MVFIVILSLLMYRACPSALLFSLCLRAPSCLFECSLVDEREKSVCVECVTFYVNRLLLYLLTQYDVRKFYYRLTR